MDAAYIKSTDKSEKILVHAWEFTDDEQVDVNDFCCPHDICGIDQKLASHLRKKKIEKKAKSGDKSGIKAGYFRVPNNSTEHHPDCPEHKANKSKRKKSNGIDPSLPYDHVSKIIFRDSADIIEPRVKGPIATINSGRHNHLRYHISNAVLWYLQNPRQGYQSLELEGCNFRKYRDVFQRIIQNPSRRYTGKHLYFGALQYKGSENFDIRNGSIHFCIYQYGAEPIPVEIKTSKMSDYKIKFIEKIYKHAERYRAQHSTPKKKLKIWIFFYGEPTHSGARSFTLDRHDCVFFHPSTDIDIDCTPHYFSPPKIKEAPRPIEPVTKPMRHSVPEKQHINHRQLQTSKPENLSDRYSKDILPPIQTSNPKTFSKRFSGLLGRIGKLFLGK
ncbi:hypothetical protein JL49_13255 [Pseudoalteromonas luteoviolacea]|nr:hypothetical protein JL49_13255 [Pseudoalteromonas luteoviolacea]